MQTESRVIFVQEKKRSKEIGILFSFKLMAIENIRPERSDILAVHWKQLERKSLVLEGIGYYFNQYNCLLSIHLVTIPPL